MMRDATLYVLHVAVILYQVSTLVLALLQANAFPDIAVEFPQKLLPNGLAAEAHETAKVLNQMEGHGGHACFALLGRPAT